MKRRVALVTVLAVALVLASIVAGRAESPSFLYGKIATESGAPVKNQPLVIEGNARLTDTWVHWAAHVKKPLRVHALTDGNGTFQVLNLPAGVYTLKALRLGGEPVLIREFMWDGSSKEIGGTVSHEKLLPVAGASTTNNTLEK